MVAAPPTVAGLGMHPLRWEYVKDDSGSVGEGCGWRASSSNNHQSSIILHQFRRLYGPGVDEPICMIEAAGDYAGTYYYHFDALGSVIALTDADANDVQKYDYSVWGQVGAWDADHPNPYLFTGRRFDTETGLYYYRARYYHPEIGRFLQTDPIGYGDGMNWHSYCRNSPLSAADPSGLATNYLYNEYTGYIYELTARDDNGADWTLEGIANWQAVDPSQIETLEFLEYSIYVIRTAPTGYWSDSSDAVAGGFTIMGDDHSDSHSQSGSGETYRPVWANAVDWTMDLLPADDTLYRVGDVCTTVGKASGVAAIAAMTAGAATPALTAQGLLPATGALAASEAVLGTSSAGTVTSVFYCGYGTAGEAAALAGKNGWQMLENVGNDPAGLSAAYARAATGTAYCVQNGVKGVPIPEVIGKPVYWVLVEYPILFEKGLTIVYHVWNGTEWVDVH